MLGHYTKFSIYRMGGEGSIGIRSHNEVITQQQQAELDALRKQRHETIRTTVDALEDLLYSPMPLLDHGFIRVVDYMGDDGAIVQAARVSYGRGTRRTSDDRGLILLLIPNPPKDTDGRREDRRRGMRELQGRWPGLDWGRWEVGGGTSVTAQAPNGRLRELGCAGWQ